MEELHASTKAPAWQGEGALEAGAVWGMDYTWDQVITLEVPGGDEKEVPVIGTYDPEEDNRSSVEQDAESLLHQ